MGRPHPLTARQRRLLDFIQSQAPAVPTVREMSEAIGVASTNAHRSLRSLEAAGYIRRFDSGRRIRVIAWPSTCPVTLTPAEGLAHTRAWRARMKPYFDGLYGPEAVL